MEHYRIKKLKGINTLATHYKLGSWHIISKDNKKA